MLRWLAVLLQLSGTGSTSLSHPPEAAALIDRARSLPPEFSADILLRLAGSRLIRDRKWKQEVIEDAFVFGAHAQLPYLQHGESSSDTRSARAVSDNGLDTLTLQTRAVEAMLALDHQRAAAMFDEIALPRVPPLACTDVLIPDLSAYYRTATVVFERGFTKAQREKEEDVAFLDRIAGAVQSPPQVAPALKLILTAKLSDEQRLALAGRFAAALGQVNETV